MRTIAIIAGILMVGLTQMATAASNSADTQKKEDTKGMTMEDIGRGLKSAAHNIEKEIPKIGPRHRRHRQEDHRRKLRETKIRASVEREEIADPLCTRPVTPHNYSLV